MKKIICSILLILPMLLYANIHDKVNLVVRRINQTASVGVDIASAEGKHFYSYHASHLYTPASNMKIFTTIAALLYLGPDYHFRTRLFSTTKQVRRETLHANLYLDFSGDPTLTYNDLKPLFLHLKHIGVKRIKGNFYFDTSAFDDDNMAPGWNKSDYGFCYSAPINAVIINHNCNRSRSVMNLSNYTVVTIHRLLKKYHIKLEGNIANRNINSHLYLIAQHRSAPLSKLIYIMMKVSDNIIAEALFKKLAQQYYHRSGTWNNGAKAIKSIIYDQLHVNISRSVIVGGSGLSHYNEASPRQFVNVLTAAYHDKKINHYFMKSLPLSGMDGTLHHRMRSTSVRGKVSAKTGSLRGASALSGYVHTRHHGVYVFSIIVNDFKGSLNPYRALQDKILTYLRQY